MGCASSLDIGHVVKTIVLGLGTNSFDVFSDVGNGLYHYHPKNVTRYMGNVTMVTENLTQVLGNFTMVGDNSTSVPDNCFPHDDFNVTGMFDCEEQDIKWAMITFACIQLPAVVLALCGALGALWEGCIHGFGYGEPKMLLGSFLILLVPFPLLVFSQQVASLCIRNAQMEFLSSVFLFGEGSLVASPSCFYLSMSFSPTLRGRWLGSKSCR